MTELQERMFSLRDAGYAEFQAKLIPGMTPESLIGVRVPELRKLAKEIKNTPMGDAFLSSLPHAFYDENLLHAVLLCGGRDYPATLAQVEAFLPYIDNWAVCDTLRPKAFAKHKAELLPKAAEWIASKATYTCRFGLDCLMTYYLDEDFRPEYPELAASVRSDEYYVNMMQAWYFATALAKQWEAVIPFLTENRLSDWVHNKTIQKARESFRITEAQKEYLKTLRR